MNTKIAVAAGLAAVLAAVFAAPQAALAADVNVDITVGSSTKSTDAFAPNPVTANVGDTVIWTNKDSTPHTATAGSAGVSTGQFGGTTSAPLVIIGAGTQSYTTTVAGDIPYYCILHPVMVGTLTVVAGTPTPKESTATATLDGNNYVVMAKSTTSMATGAEIDAAEKSVSVTFDKAGEVELTLPKTMISDITGVMAGDAAITDFEKVDAADSTTLTFTIPAGETEVDIMGGFVVPEFPLIAALVLGITIAAIVGYTRFAKGSTLGFGRV